MSRPIIGLTMYRERARWGVWDERADLQSTRYTDAVAASGGAVVLVPPADAPDEIRLAYRLAEALLRAIASDTVIH